MFFIDGKYYFCEYCGRLSPRDITYKYGDWYVCKEHFDMYVEREEIAQKEAKNESSRREN